MRVVSPAALGRGDGDLAESLDGALASFGAGDGLAVVGQHGLGDLVADAHDGIEGGHGLLEDHGDARAAQLLQFGGAGGGQLAAVEEYRAGEPRLGRQQSHDGQGGDAFTGAGFADQSEGLSRVE